MGSFISGTERGNHLYEVLVERLHQEDLNPEIRLFNQLGRLV
ncbi:hypothetical protein KSX_63410 [Ktedonospora formicarum]|uniref:Uncharacterized protein n=1 Tax=Ktedonospora formicarum TaxID=2778364 RepID=A0A8J3MVZ9_9CHLR|nr:hypothetical protein KSX_63410 [Ktedonospora formicarum]